MIRNQKVYNIKAEINIYYCKNRVLACFQTRPLSFYARIKTKTVLESLKYFLQNGRNIFFILFFVFYLLEILDR